MSAFPTTSSTSPSSCTSTTFRELDDDPFFTFQSQDQEDLLFDLQITPDLSDIERWPSFRPAWEKDSKDSKIDRRALPLILYDYNFQELEFELKVLTPLQIGIDKWSQVWKGEMRLFSKPSRQLCTVINPVAIKLFVESLFKEYTEDNLGMTEAAAYSRMGCLQGCEIPWSFGIFKTKLQGEVVYGHILEYVHGEIARTLVDKKESPKISVQEWTEMANSMMQGIQRINDCGVSHFDVSFRNIILIKEPLQPLKVTYIDFAFSAPSVPGTASLDVHETAFALQKLGIPEEDVKSWWQDQKSKGYEWTKYLNDRDFVPVNFKVDKDYGGWPELADLRKRIRAMTTSELYRAAGLKPPSKAEVNAGTNKKSWGGAGR